jgi:prepilin signal peptidase PulO-like enzyme (type II secretory pathway)
MWNLYFGFLFFIFGTIIGSFLNVLVLRYNTGVSVTRGRSFCFSCGKKLSWLELVPILSFLLQKGKCRGCKSKISWQYPLVELLTGILFLGVFLKFGGFNGLLNNLSAMIIALISMAVLLSITVYDIKHKIIPDGLVIVFALLALLNILVVNHTHFIWFLLAGPLLALPLFLIWLVSSGKWMGLGDPKLVVSSFGSIGCHFGFLDGSHLRLDFNGFIEISFSFLDLARDRRPEHKPKE